MEIQIQGWTRDHKYPVYPVQVQAGGNGVYYTTTERAKTYKEFDFDELRCGSETPIALCSRLLAMPAPTACARPKKAPFWGLIRGAP